jgi:hypothetical protein
MSRRREPAAYRKAIRAASLPWNQRLEQRAGGIDKQARSPCRLLEQPTEATHRFNPIRWIEAQPLHDWGQVLWNRPALVCAEFPPRPI